MLLAFEFMLYTTGTCILRVVSFGLLKYQFYHYKDFRKLRENFNKNFLLQYIVGLSFYALIIITIAWFT
jgi:hypothetical protein